MSIEKQARSRAKDPHQEKLRYDKDLWNKACSEFISRLIAFKRGLNGRGDAKANLPPSKITEPLPSEVISLISELASQFSQLAQSASGISEEQHNYANSRIQSTTRVACLEPELLCLGSNVLTRFWAQLKGRLSNAPLKTERLSMLTLCANIKKDCLDFQAQIVSSGRESVEKANTIFHKIDLQLKALDSYFNSIIKSLVKEDVSLINNRNFFESNLAIIHSIVNDLVFAVKLPTLEDAPNNRSFANQILSAIKRFEKEQDESKKTFFLEQIKKMYAEFLEMYTFAFQKTLMKANIIFDLSNPTFKTLFEYQQKIDEKEKAPNTIELASPDYELEKYARNEFMLWLRNKLNKLNPMSSSSSLRVNVFESTAQFLKTLNELMNMLEKEIDPTLLKELMLKLNEQDQKIEEQFLILDQMTSAEDLKDPDMVNRLHNLIRRKKLRQMSTGF